MQGEHKANTNCILGLHSNEMKAKSYSAWMCSAKKWSSWWRWWLVGWWCQPNYNKWARLTTVSVSKSSVRCLSCDVDDDRKTYYPPVLPSTMSRPVQHRVLPTNDRTAPLQGCQRLDPLVLSEVAKGGKTDWDMNWNAGISCAPVLL